MKKIISTLVLGLAITVGLKAQTVPSPTEVMVNMEPVNEMVIPEEVLDTLSNPMSLLGPTEELNLSVSMILTDTNTVSKIHIKLGTTLGGSDLLENTYIYDGTPSEPLSYFRDGDMLTLGMGTHLNSGVFYCEIILEDSTGNTSLTITSQSDQ